MWGYMIDDLRCYFEENRKPFENFKLEISIQSDSYYITLAVWSMSKTKDLSFSDDEMVVWTSVTAVGMVRGA